MTEQKFFDVSQFSPEEGMLICGISMSRISNVQSPEKYFEYLKHIGKKIVKTKGIGMNFWYADYLYMHTEKESPDILRDRFLGLMTQHKNGFLNILEKNLEWIPKAFSFTTFGQVYLDNSRIALEYFIELKKIYKNDLALQKCVASDAGISQKELSTGQANFFLEESLLFYLASKGVLSLNNEFINHHEKWILNCYPGKPLYTEVYIYKKNLFNLINSKNKYENHFYDLEEKKLYDLTKIDIESFNFS
ncbi:MAG: hypothetical protein Q7S34_00895 [bacterium]|nr:hypothetical protein [bacterium]